MYQTDEISACCGVSIINGEFCGECREHTGPAELKDDDQVNRLIANEREYVPSAEPYAQRGGRVSAAELAALAGCCFVILTLCIAAVGLAK